MLPNESTSALTVFQAVTEKRLRRIALLMRITAGLVFVMGLAGGWNIFTVYGRRYIRRWVTNAAGGQELVWIRYFELSALKVALPVAIVLLGIATTYLILSFPARRGSGAAARVAGIMAMVCALLSAITTVLPFAYGVAISETVDTWWEQTLAVGLLVVCVAAVPWFLYMTVAGFDSGRRRKGRRAGFVVEQAKQEQPPEIPKGTDSSIEDLID